MPSVTDYLHYLLSTNSSCIHWPEVKKCDDTRISVKININCETTPENILKVTDTFIIPRLKPNNSYPILWGHRGYLKVISPFSGMYLVSFLLSLKRNPLMLVAPAPEARSTIADQGESCITITSACELGPHWASEHSVVNGFNESGWPVDQAL